MSENSTNDALNSSENDEDFRVSTLLLRNEIKRRVHNGIEKRRKDKINYWIHKLAELLPFKEPKRESKTHLLENIYQYINQLNEKNNSLMFGSVNSITEVHVEEIRRLTKRCKELEEKNMNYYRLLEMAGISPNSCPQDIQFERPTKYSKKISEQQLNNFLAKNSDKMFSKMSSNKRSNDSDDNNGQTSNKKIKLSKSRSKKRKERERERNLKNSPPTPVMPKISEQSLQSLNTSVRSVTSGTASSGSSIVLLNDQNLSTVSGVDETPRLILNASNNSFNGLNSFQFRQTVGSQQLQFVSTNPTIDGLSGNTNLLSGQILFNLNPPAPPPQPQATAVLLPNGQILPIISQTQPQTQSLILAPNQSFLLTTPTSNQTQQTVISGQSADISSNVKTNKTNSSSEKTSESEKPEPELKDKPKDMTTTIETIVVKEKPKKKLNKNLKKQIFLPKGKNSKKDKRKQDFIGSKEKEEKLLNNSKKDTRNDSESKTTKETKTTKTSDTKITEKPVIISFDKNKIKSRSSDKNLNEKSNENNVKTNKNSKSKPVLTGKSGTPDKKMKDTSNCDILAKATQSIFSPPPNTCPKQRVISGNKKDNKTNDNKSGDNQKDVSINDNHNRSNGNKCKTDLESNRVKSRNAIKKTENEVNIGFCGNSSADSSVSNCDTTSANIPNKANIELINDTNKNDNYVHNRTASQHNSKIEKTIASGNKAEINKKSVNNLNNSNTNASTGSSSAQTTTSTQNKLSNASTPERTAIQTSNCHSDVRHESFSEQNMTSNSDSDNNRLSFEFSSHENRLNSTSIANNDNSNADNQTIVNENELPSILLSLNDANEETAESVHSVSNSSLPAFLSLSPEHLNEYLPKDNITNSTENETSNRVQTLSSDVTPTQFRLNSSESNIEQHSSVTTQQNTNRHDLEKDEQNYTEYSKANEVSVAPTSQTETRSYTSNFPTISTLITNDYYNPELSLTPTKSMFASNNSTNYFENFYPNPLMNPKMNSQNNNFLQNDNSLMSLYPMPSYPIHNYLQNNTNSNNTNRNTFFGSHESQSTSVNNTTPKSSQNPNQSQTTQSRSQTTTHTQQPKSGSVPQTSQSQPQNQSNAVIPMRSQRNSSTEQQLQTQHTRHTSQHTSPVGSNSSSSNNKTNSVSSASVQYSTQNSFSSYSAEALIRQNEPTVQQIQTNEQNRYNPNASASAGQRVGSQPTHNTSNMSFNDRNSSRASISYSAESLIQSNPMNTSNQISNKSSQREVENQSLNGINGDNNNRISYYQHISHNNASNNSNVNSGSNQRTEQNNLFHFDHSFNSRIMSSTSQNCGNTYPQITFNSHLPEIRTPTTTTSSEPLFPITSNASTVNSTSNRSLSSNSGNSITNNNSNNSSINGNNSGNNQISQTIPTIGGPQHQSQQQPPQHSPVIYPSNGSQNSNSHQTNQTKRSTNNSFNSGVNAFIQSNADNYPNPSNSNIYQTTGPPLVDPNLNPNSNHYQRSPRSGDIRFGNCVQPTNQNSNPAMAQHNNPNTTCFFPNTPSNTTYFPSTSATPFPPLLPSAPSPFDPTTPFGTAHRPPMFPNTFIPDFNPSYLNTGANNPLPAISGTNFNINPSVTNNNSSNATNKSRETHSTTSRSSSNMSQRSPNPSKHSKVSANSNTSNTKTKKQNNSKHNDNSNNSSTRNSNDNYFSMNDLMSLTTPTNQNTNRYTNFLPNTQPNNQSRQPVPSPSASSSHTTNANNKNVTSSADTSSYSLFRPQSQNVNNSSNASNAANFSVNSLQNTNRSAPTSTATSTPSNFGSSSGGHHSSHATNFHLSNIFPDINSSNESLALSPMKFPPPVPPVVPPVGPPLGQPSMDANPYPNHHSNGHHQNLYHTHQSSARISTPHNAFNPFLTSGNSSTHNPNTHSFDPQITPNNRTSVSAQIPGVVANSSHSTSTLGAPQSHSHHTYNNIVPSFNF